MVNCCTILVVLLALYVPATQFVMRMAASLPVPFFSVERWSLADMPELEGRVAIVTGGNSGLGYITAQELARKGCHVVIGCRNAAKGEQARQQILNEVVRTQAQVTVLPLVLNDLQSVDEFARTFLAKFDRLDILVNNAGKLFDEYGVTEQQIELNMGVHHVGHFLLSFRLLPLLQSTAAALTGAAAGVGSPSRIVNVASHAHLRAPTIDFQQLHNASAYSAMGWYAQSKLANILFTRELARRLSSPCAISQGQVLVNAAHPGFVITDFSWAQALPGVKYIAYDAATGALTQLHLAVSKEISDFGVTGQYFYPVAMQARWGVETSAAAHDATLQDELWSWTLGRLSAYDPSFSDQLQDCSA